MSETAPANPETAPEVNKEQEPVSVETAAPAVENPAAPAAAVEEEPVAQT